MDKNYELFIKQLINGIHGTIGIPMENMEFARKAKILPKWEIDFW